MRFPKPLAAAACLAFAPAACAHPAAPPIAEAKPANGADAPGLAGVRPGVVDGPTARKLAQAGVVIVDVRTPPEFDSGHVPNAKNIPVDEVASRAAEIGSPSTPVLVYCRTGHRSGMAREALQRLGFTAVYDMGPISTWERSAP